MKSTRNHIIFLCILLAIVVNTYAQSPPEKLLQEMVQQLQGTPDDDALREKIIKFAAEIKPAPTVPDTAVSFEGRAQFAFRSAESEGDFLEAAQEYEKAVAVAPWVPGYYADLCTIYEKAGRFEDAKRNCELYMIGLTDPAQMTDVKRRIAGLEFGIERSSPSAQLKREEDEFMTFMRDNEGAIFNTAPSSGQYSEGNYIQAIIENGAVVIGSRYVNEDWLSLNPQMRGKLWDSTHYAVEGFTSSVPFVCASPNITCLKTLIFSSDGRTLTTSFMQPGADSPFVQVFIRAN